jgi:dGTPase
MVPDAMKWDKLLSKTRQGKSDEEEPTIGRSSFQRDFDRVVYSSAFRRLQDKAQVFPLAKSDFVRTRLTHSLEVSCVGRSLGTDVGIRLRDTGRLPEDISPGDVGSVVAAACLAHDIGNPPFGHTGEDAIREWFTNTDVGREAIRTLDADEVQDFKLFEGNAQGFRLLTKLQNSHNPGLQLECATLAAFTKYPRPSSSKGEPPKGVSWKKHGYFQTEKSVFEEVAAEVGLLQRDKEFAAWMRHPLAYLVEAADDICYRINDLEDGFRLKHVSQIETEDLLLRLFPSGKTPKKLEQISGSADRIGYLRAKAINELISQLVISFMEHESKLLCGEFQQPLIDVLPSGNVLEEIFVLSRKKIYKAREVLEIEVPGFKVLGGLLEAFVCAANEVAEKGEKRSSIRNSRILLLMPDQFLGKDRVPDENPYIRTLQVTDFLSGMTDSFAVALYKQITGISLPSA